MGTPFINLSARLPACLHGPACLFASLHHWGLALFPCASQRARRNEQPRAIGSRWGDKGAEGRERGWRWCNLLFPRKTGPYTLLSFSPLTFALRFPRHDHFVLFPRALSPPVRPYRLALLANNCQPKCFLLSRSCFLLPYFFLASSRMRAPSLLIPLSSTGLL